MLKFICLVILLTLLKNKCYSAYLQTCHPDDQPNDVFNKTGYSEIGPPILYRDVGSVLKFLQRPEFKNVTAVQKLLEYYNQAKDKKEKSDLAGGSRKYPLIVLEGMSGTGKTTLSRSLIPKINCTQIHSPPDYVKILRASIRQNFELDMAYQAMGNYIGGLEVSQLLNKSPVVMDRFWHSYVALAIATAHNNYPEKYQFPAEGDQIYTWPDDLLKPDIVMFLNVDEDIRQQRMSKRRNLLGVPESPNSLNKFLKGCPAFLKNMLLVYKRMNNPGAVMVNGNPSVNTVLEDIYLKVTPLFAKNII